MTATLSAASGERPGGASHVTPLRLGTTASQQLDGGAGSQQASVWPCSLQQRLTCNEQEDGTDCVHPLRQPCAVIVVILQHSAQVHQCSPLAQCLRCRAATKGRAIALVACLSVDSQSSEQPPPLSIAAASPTAIHPAICLPQPYPPTDSRVSLRRRPVRPGCSYPWLPIALSTLPWRPLAPLMLKLPLAAFSRSALGCRCSSGAAGCSAPAACGPGAGAAAAASRPPAAARSF